MKDANHCKQDHPRNLKLKLFYRGDSKTESGLHEMFSHLRENGEWFRYTKEIKWFIRAIQEHPDTNCIKRLHRLSLQMRLLEKSRRLGKGHKLTSRLKNVYNVK